MVVQPVVGPRMYKLKNSDGQPSHTWVIQDATRESCRAVFTLLIKRGSTFGAAGTDVSVSW